MGTSTLAAFAEQISNYPRTVALANRTAVVKSALAITTDIRAAMTAASGGDNRLSGVGRRGARIGARYDVKGTTNPTALIRATGPAHLVERPTSAHRIEPRRRGRGRRPVLVINGRPVAYANHPGSRRPSRPWARGVARGVPEAQRIFADVHAQTLRRAFGG